MTSAVLCYAENKEDFKTEEQGCEQTNLVLLPPIVCSLLYFCLEIPFDAEMLRFAPA